MTQDEMLRTIIKTLDNKKAESIKAIKITDLTILADYFVIANGTSTTPTKTLAEVVDYQLSQNGSSWVILDYGDIVVHVFYKETRDYYQLERLWADGEKIDIERFLTEGDQIEDK